MNKLQLSPLLLKLVIRVGVLGAIFYIAACLFLFFLQVRFIFFPSPHIQATPEMFRLAYQEVWLSVPNSLGQVERIHGWWIPSNQPNAKVLLYLHGNGINIGANVAHAHRFYQMGFAVLLIDYRGYGQSEGSFPNESRVYQDAAAAWKYLVQERQLRESQIFIYGHSLGGAIAINLATQHPNAAGLIVESSFTSIREIIDYLGRYRLFPVDLILHQRFNSIAKVQALQMPVLFIHGKDDWQVPAIMSQKLYAAAPEPKNLLLVPGAGHNNVAEVAGSQYFQAVQNFVQQVEKAGASL